jgi:opacity protein-like surface antigen
MKKLLLLSIFASLACSTAFAEPQYYIEAKGGSILKTKSLNKNDFAGKLSKSANFGAAIGMQPTDHFAVDVSLLYTPNLNYKFNGTHTYEDETKERPKYVHTKFKSLSVMLNGYYYLLDNSQSIIPYVGAGIGMARNTIANSKTYIDNEFNYTHKGKTSSNLAWGLTAGTLFNINNDFKLTLEYRFSDLGKFKDGKIHYIADGRVANVDQSKTRLRSHSIMAGLRYQF